MRTERLGVAALFPSSGPVLCFQHSWYAPAAVNKPPGDPTVNPERSVSASAQPCPERSSKAAVTVCGYFWGVLISRKTLGCNEWPLAAASRLGRGALALWKINNAGMEYRGEIGMKSGLFALLLAIPLFSGECVAQDYPTRTVKIIVPFGAGGPADVAARLIGNILQDGFKQPFVVEDRPGAGAQIGTLEVARSAPDGYTLLMMSNTQTANESLIPERKYELMRDLVPIAPINSSDLVIVVNPAVQAKTLQEFIALAKAQPGQLNYASSGQGTPYHMAGELFKTMAGIDAVHVPYRSSGEARSGVIGGQVQMMIDAVTTMAPNVGAGQVRALATTGKARSAVLPDVPTADEAGVAGYDATIWLGLMAPAGTPKPVLEKLNAAINVAIKQPEIVSLWAKQGAVPMSMTVAEFDSYLRGDIVKWAGVVKKIGEKTQ
jgi:tripartite-type tricarboxylate transporter receptor subunit TctC